MPWIIRHSALRLVCLAVVCSIAIAARADSEVHFFLPDERPADYADPPPLTDILDPPTTVFRTEVAPALESWPDLGEPPRSGLHSPTHGLPPWWSSITGQYGLLANDPDQLIDRHWGGVSAYLSGQLTDTLIVQVAAGFDFAQGATDIGVIFGLSKLATCDCPHGWDRVATGLAGEYVTERPDGRNDWGLQFFASYLLSPWVELGGKVALGSERGDAGLDDVYLGYAALYPKDELAVMAYLGGNAERDLVTGGLLAVGKLNPNVSLFADLGAADDSFGLSVGGQYFFGPGAPRNDGRAGLYHRFFGQGGFAAMPAYRTRLR